MNIQGCSVLSLTLQHLMFQNVDVWVLNISISILKGFTMESNPYFDKKGGRNYFNCHTFKSYLMISGQPPVVLFGQSYLCCLAVFHYLLVSITHNGPLYRWSRALFAYSHEDTLPSPSTCFGHCSLHKCLIIVLLQISIHFLRNTTPFYSVLLSPLTLVHRF